MRAIAALFSVCLLSACGSWLEDFDLRNDAQMHFNTSEGKKIYYRVGKTWSGHPFKYYGDGSGITVYGGTTPCVTGYHGEDLGCERYGFKPTLGTPPEWGARCDASNLCSISSDYLNIRILLRNDTIVTACVPVFHASEAPKASETLIEMGGITWTTQRGPKAMDLHYYDCLNEEATRQFAAIFAEGKNLRIRFIHPRDNKPVESRRPVDGVYKDALRIARFVARQRKP